MQMIGFLLQNFFTHKDFLPPADQLAGTLFTPLHLVFAACALAVTVIAFLKAAKWEEKKLQRVYAVLWLLVVVLEAAKMAWETVSGKTVNFEWGGMLPLYPCSIFMYAMPFAIWGKGLVRKAACGYVCSLGLLGGAINFIYPANILGAYSCISFAGMHTFFYHGTLVFCALSMMLSGYYDPRWVKKWYHLLVPAIPCFVVSIVANAVNFSPIDSDYMFFKLESFFFAPLGQATADWLSVVIVYMIYALIHALPSLPFFFQNRKDTKTVSV